MRQRKSEDKKKKGGYAFSFRTLNKTSNLFQINHLVIRNINEYFPRPVVLLTQLSVSRTISFHMSQNIIYSTGVKRSITGFKIHCDLINRAYYKPSLDQLVHQWYILMPCAMPLVIERISLSGWGAFGNPFKNVSLFLFGWFFCFVVVLYVCLLVLL